MIDRRRIGAVVSAWTLIGVAALFATAIYRLSGRGIATIQAGLEWGEWVVLVLPRHDTPVVLLLKNILMPFGMNIQEM